MNRVAALRVSLLIAMGIVPAACGGTTNGRDPDTGEPQGGSGGSSGGTRPHAGSPTNGGSGVVIVGGTASGGTGVVTGGAAPSGGVAGEGGYQCSSPKLDPKTGLVTCNEGFAHRPTQRLCGVNDTGAAGASGAEAGAGGGPSDAEPLPRANGSVPCTAENKAICNQFELGYCEMNGGGAAIFVCRSGCVSDQDCGAGQICLCDNPASPSGGTCHAASCSTDKDCGNGLCASYYEICGDIGYACLTPQDECVTSADCPDQGICAPGPSGVDAATVRRECISGVACGRPFLVHAEPRVAPLAHGGGWRESQRLAPQTQHLTSAERAALAAHWSYMGQLEHASIAAFARFSLQLLSLGAPPDLVEACTQALADETAHTRLCFELASAYAGRAVGPGPLDVAGSLEATSLVDVVDLVLAEGCFGETGAALDAFAAAESAADPVIADAYARIAADEQRHAELAFRFVRWALERGGSAVAERIAAAIAAPPSATSNVNEVTLPCLRAVLEAAGSPLPPTALAEVALGVAS